MRLLKAFNLAAKICMRILCPFQEKTPRRPYKGTLTRQEIAKVRARQRSLRSLTTAINNNPSFFAPPYALA